MGGGGAKNTFNFPNIDFEIESKRNVRLETNEDIITFIQVLIRNEVKNQVEPEVWFDSFKEFDLIFRYLLREEMNYEKKIKCNQLVHFYKGSYDGTSIDNIKILHSILPYVITSQSICNIRYAYVDGSSRDSLFSIWPHYLLFTDGVLLISEGLKSALYMNEPTIVENYHLEIQKLMEDYHEVFGYHGSGEEALGFYLTENMNRFPDMSLNGCPCIEWMLTPQILMSEKDNVILQNFRQIYLNAMKTTKLNDKKIGFFQLNGLEEFYNTGILPGIYGNYLRKCTLSERKKMLFSVMDNDTDVYWNKYLLKDGYVNLNDIVIELFEKQQSVLIIFTDVKHFMILNIKENGIYEAFKDYLISLKESNYSYSPEEGKEEYKKRINDIIKNNNVND